MSAALAQVPPASPFCEVIGRADDREDWLAKRRTGIGASEAWRLFSEPYALWAEKSGLVVPENIDDDERVKWGRRAEPIIIDAFREETGLAAAREGGTHRGWLDHRRFRQHQRGVRE